MRHKVESHKQTVKFQIDNKKGEENLQTVLYSKIVKDPPASSSSAAEADCTTPQNAPHPKAPERVSAGHVTQNLKVPPFR